MAVVTKGISVREIITAFIPALLVKAVRYGIGGPESLTVVELREALVQQFLQATK